MVSRVVLSLVSALLALTLLFSSPAPTSAAVCGGSGFDLSSLTFSDLLYTGAYYFYFHPCGNVTAPACQGLESQVAGGTMLCQVELAGTGAYSIATWVPEVSQSLTTWTPFGGGNGGGQAARGVRMQLQDGQTCNISGVITPRALTVNFQCSQQYPAGVANMSTFVEQSTCNYVATVLTSATCNGPNATSNGQQPCGTTGLNLSPITTTDLIWKDTANNYTYYFRPCGIVTSPQCANNPYGSVAGESMMCQATGLNGEISMNTYDISYWNPQLANWRRFNYQGVTGNVNGWVMSIQDGTSCNNGISRALTVYWVCSTAATTPIFLYLNETSECNYQAVVQTIQACNNSQIITSVVPCGGPYDLSAASARDLIYQTPGSTQYFVFRPCGVVDNAVCQAQGNTNQSMLCQAYQGSTGTYDIAIYNPALVTYTPTLTGIQMFIQDGDFCAVANIARSLTVNFVCQQGLGNNQVFNFVNFQEAQTCQYVATVNTQAVCRTGRQNGFCGSGNYDFSLSGNSEYAYQTGGYIFYFQPCGQVINSQCNANSATASSMMCQTVIGSSATYDLAFYDSQLVSWYRLANGGWQMFVQDGQSCSSYGYERALTVNFLCGTGAIMTNVTEVSTCNYVAYVFTPQACQPVSNGAATGLNIDAQSSSGNNINIPAYEKITQCGGIYNLLPLSSSDLTYVDPNYNWVFRTCGSVTSNKNCTAAIAAAATPGGWMLCQDSRNAPGDYEGSAYNQYTVTWTTLRSGVLMTQADGASCSNGPRVTRAYFQCNASATTAVMYNVTESPTCTYNLYIWTSLACPSPATTCGGAGYNITSLTARSDLSYTSSAGYIFYFAPCGVVQASACQANLLTQSAMACQASTTSNSTYNLATYAPQATTWSAYPGGGVQMVLQDGSTCDGYDFQRVFTAIFLCGLGGGSQLLNVSEVSTCNYVAFVNSGQTCAQLAGNGGTITPSTSSGAAPPVVNPTAGSTTTGGGGGSSGLSGGAIAGIVIGSVVGAIILLGLLLVAFCGVGFGRKKSSSADDHQPRTTGKYGNMEGDTEASQSGVEMETTHHGETSPEVVSE